MYFETKEDRKEYFVECNYCPNRSIDSSVLDVAIDDWNSRNTMQKAKVKYICGKCKAELHLGFATCPKCGSEIDWGE